MVVTGEHVGETDGQYLHHGIATRPFARRFELADHVKVTGAQLVNGLLTIDLQREVPEEKKPRRIKVESATTHADSAPRQVETSQKQAA